MPKKRTTQKRTGRPPRQDYSIPDMRQLAIDLRDRSVSIDHLATMFNLHHVNKAKLANKGQVIEILENLRDIFETGRKVLLPYLTPDELRALDRVASGSIASENNGAE